MNTYPVPHLFAATFASLFLLQSTYADVNKTVSDSSKTTLSDSQPSSVAEGFQNYGPPNRISEHRGALIVDSGDGVYKLLVNLCDVTGQYGILLVDPLTGESKFHEYPGHKPEEAGFAVLYSKAGNIYTQYGGRFYEFDPKKGEFTFQATCADESRCAMLLTEGDDGVIWAADYPKSTVMSFDPKSRKFTEYGSINSESWPQYPRGLAVDDAGWVYLGIGVTKSQIVAFDPATRTIKKLVPEEERSLGDFDIRVAPHVPSTKGILWRGVDGNVYAHMPAHTDHHPWFRLHKGEVERLDDVSSIQPVEQRAGYQFLVQGKLPNGGMITDLDVPGRTFNFIGSDSRMRKVKFDYPSMGPRLTSMVLGPDGRIYGSTGLPLQFFALDPVSGKYHLAEKAETGHINAFASMGDSVYGAIYTQGVLVRHEMNSNPSDLSLKTLTQAGEAVLRPFGLLALSSGKELVMFGSPGYGMAGGGLMFYDTATHKKIVIEHADIVPNQCTKALVELPNGNLVGGTSIEAGTGGQPIAHVANLYVMEMPSRKVVFSEPLIPGTPQYRDLLVGSDGLVYGLAGTYGIEENADFLIGGDPLFFVFDPVSKKIIHQEKLPAEYGTLTGAQAPRVMHMGPDGKIYLLLSKSIVRIDPKTFRHECLAQSPVHINTGIAITDDKVFFTSGSEMWSYRLPVTTGTTTHL